MPALLRLEHQDDRGVGVRGRSRRRVHHERHRGATRSLRSPSGCRHASRSGATPRAVRKPSRSVAGRRRLRPAGPRGCRCRVRQPDPSSAPARRAVVLLAFAAAARRPGCTSTSSRDLPDLRWLEDYRPPLTSVVLDREGRPIGEFYEERRRLVPPGGHPAPRRCRPSWRPRTTRSSSTRGSTTPRSSAPPSPTSRRRRDPPGREHDHAADGEEPAAHAGAHLRAQDPRDDPGAPHRGAASPRTRSSIST